MKPCVIFDIPRSSTNYKKWVQTFKVKTAGAERLRFTVILTARVKHIENEFSAFRLPPLVIFKNLVKAPSGKYPPGMQLLGSKGGTMKRCMMKELHLEEKASSINGLYQKPSWWWSWASIFSCKQQQRIPMAEWYRFCSF